MAPKIRACLSFVEKGGQKAVITEATKLEDRRYGSKITCITIKNRCTKLVLELVFFYTFVHYQDFGI